MKIFKISFRNELDLLSQDLTRYIFNNFIKNNLVIPNYVEITNYKFNLLKKFDIISINLNISKANHNEPFSISGLFGQFSHTIDINIFFNEKKFRSIDYAQLYLLLNIYIRHELEHGLYYRNRDIEITSIFDIKNNIVNTVKHNQKYLLEKTEMNSNIRAFMLQAKKTKTPILTIAEKWLTNLLLSDKFMDKWEILKNNLDNNTTILINNILNNLLLAYKQEIIKIFPESSSL